MQLVARGVKPDMMPSAIGLCEGFFQRAGVGGQKVGIGRLFFTSAVHCDRTSDQLLQTSQLSTVNLVHKNTLVPTLRDLVNGNEQSMRSITVPPRHTPALCLGHRPGARPSGFGRATLFWQLSMR
jgi:hypothetical protein